MSLKDFLFKKNYFVKIKYKTPKGTKIEGMVFRIYPWILPTLNDNVKKVLKQNKLDFNDCEIISVVRV